MCEFEKQKFFLLIAARSVSNWSQWSVLPKNSSLHALHPDCWMPVFQTMFLLLLSNFSIDGYSEVYILFLLHSALCHSVALIDIIENAAVPIFFYSRTNYKWSNAHRELTEFHRGDICRKSIICRAGNSYTATNSFSLYTSKDKFRKPCVSYWSQPLIRKENCSWFMSRSLPVHQTMPRRKMIFPFVLQ